MPAEISDAMKAELDQLEVSEVLEVMFGYVAGRHRLLRVGGEAKIVALMVEGNLRKAYLELGMSPKTLDLLAA